MKRTQIFATVAMLLLVLAPSVLSAPFTPQLLIEGIRIVDHSKNYPGGSYNVDNLLDGVTDGSRGSEYSSHGKGLETFVVFDLGKPMPIIGFEHIDRHDSATIAASKLVFSNSPDGSQSIAVKDVRHANRPGGKTRLRIEPVTARYVRWQVTKLGEGGHGTVGGAEIRFFTAGKTEPLPMRTTVVAETNQAILRSGGEEVQLLKATIRYPYADPTDAVIELTGCKPVEISLEPGQQEVEIPSPPVDKETAATVTVKVDGQTVAQSELSRKPVRPWVFYILPHSHVDIGYTHVQTDVMQRQWDHFDLAIDLAEKTAKYPPGAQFKWNAEVLWAVDSFLKESPPEKKERFLKAVRKGQIGIDGLYGNELTALCRPEELMRLLDCANRLRKQYGIPIDSAMISDVPGYTWGLVPVLAQNGIKYFSVGPNHRHRIGHTLEAWGDKAFYWVGPSGNERVLFWMDGKGYAWFLYDRGLEQGKFFKRLDDLQEKNYPYDLIQVRYTIGADNGPPDPKLPEFVKAWNEKYVYPEMIIATTGEMFREFDKRYGDKLAEETGDFTPYWEDGAGSTSRETALTRNASERLVQAEALWAMLNPEGYPADAFSAAWREAILYNEHTWGANCSISKPDDPFTKSQWKIKQAFALEADKQSHKLLDAAVAGHRSDAKTVAAIDIYNTASWARTDLVLLPPNLKLLGDVVKTADGTVVPSQRLASGELALLATDVPPFGAKRFVFAPGKAAKSGKARAHGSTLTNGMLQLAVDPKTGAVARLTAEGIQADLVDQTSGMGLDAYRYVSGRNAEDVSGNGPVTIAVQESGPLVASLVVETEAAPGCRKLIREFRMIDGLNRVDITNLVDKERIRAKESVHFGFAFNVPDGVIRINTPWAVVRPDVDQLPGACKNYFTAGRWVDVSGAAYGVTWATLDAPLVEVGKIRVDVPGPYGIEGWATSLEPTQTFYSYVMNNYWETNYKASQQGPTTFRYAIRPHGPYDAIRATHFGIERSQPLVAVPADTALPAQQSLLTIEPASVIATLLRPSEDGKARILRLFNVGDKTAQALVRWSDPAPKRVRITTATGDFKAQVEGPIEIPPHGIVTLRAEQP